MTLYLNIHPARIGLSATWADFPAWSLMGKDSRLIDSVFFQILYGFYGAYSKYCAQG